MPIIATMLPLQSLTGMEDAYLFLDWLKKNRQSGWLQLPISENVGTPYRNFGIGVDGYFFDTRLKKDRQAWMITRDTFLQQNESWIFDYALYKAISDFFGNDKWWEWPDEIKKRDRDNIHKLQRDLSTQIEGYLDEQYYLTNQLMLLKEEATKKDLLMIGDLPFYIDQKSSLVWANQHCFLLSSDGELRITSGVPKMKDEPFSEQVWNHPLYDWQDAGASEILRVFEQRLLYMSQIYDMVRVDHANGFFRYGAIYPKNPSWNKKIDGPGIDAATEFLSIVQKFNLGLFFEDIGSDTTKLEYFMKEYNIMGMKVMTLGINTDATNDNGYENPALFNLKNYDGNCVAFSSTHDTATLFGWIRSLTPEAKLRLQMINGWGDNNLSDEQLAMKIREGLIESKAKMVVIPWQDWHLETFRYNVPGKEELSDWFYKIRIKDYM
ncbi:MAG: 4-alpha-glucanotransferase [Pseudomonadales bacterium]|jgi:4-alpha-glucanotransferase|nr:4-alpha-glucanotransferase [Pseudomonadales bacterium]